MKRLLIGVSMVPRGEVALVITGLGFTNGHITHHVLISLLLVTIGVALVGPLLIAELLHHAASSVFSRDNLWLSLPKD